MSKTGPTNVRVYHDTYVIILIIKSNSRNDSSIAVFPSDNDSTSFEQF